MAARRWRQRVTRVTEAITEPLVDDGRRGSYLVAAGIFLSRIAGLVREIAISGLLGVGTAADAFKAALRIPNLLQNLLGEGVLSASFIPVYAKLLDEDETASRDGSPAPWPGSCAR